MQEQYVDQAQEEDLGEEEYYEDEEDYDGYEDYDAPQIGDTIVTAGQNNDAWDDTALIEAWDEAVKEYQTYHSTLTANDPPFSNKVTSKPAKATTEPAQKQPPTKKRPPPVAAENELDITLNSTTIKRAKTSSTRPKVVPKQTEQASATHDEVHPVQTEAESQATWEQYHNYWSHQGHATPAPPPPPAPPQQVSADGEDEALSNLMMAWYYSGYYTGYYQAMRRR